MKKKEFKKRNPVAKAMHSLGLKQIVTPAKQPYTRKNVKIEVEARD